MRANAENHASIPLAPPSVNRGGMASRLGFLASAVLHAGLIGALCLAWGSGVAFQPFQGGGDGGPFWVRFSADAKTGLAGGGGSGADSPGDSTPAALSSGGPESAGKSSPIQAGQSVTASRAVPQRGSLPPLPPSIVSPPNGHVAEGAPETPLLPPKKYKTRTDGAPRKPESAKTGGRAPEPTLRQGAASSRSLDVSRKESVTKPETRAFSSKTALRPQEGSSGIGSSRGGASGATGAGAVGNSEGGAFSGGSGAVETVLGGTEGPAFLRFMAPDYPASARRRGIEGLVTLRVRINERGQPERIEVVDSVDESLSRAASRAVERAAFVPYSPGGRPCPCWTLVPVRFRLK